MKADPSEITAAQTSTFLRRFGTRLRDFAAAALWRLPMRAPFYLRPRPFDTLCERAIDSVASRHSRRSCTWKA
jgi:hypothetical protein